MRAMQSSRTISPRCLSRLNVRSTITVRAMLDVRETAAAGKAPTNTGARSLGRPRSMQQQLAGGLTQNQVLVGQLVGSAADLMRASAAAAAVAVVEAERRLEAELSAVAGSVLFMVGVIFYDYGVQSLLDRLLGDSPMGDVSCIVSGLGLIVAVKLAGGKVANLWSLGP